MPLALFLLSALVGVRVAYDRGSSWPTLMVILLGIAVYYLIICASRSGVPVSALGLLGVLGSAIVASYFVTQCGHLEYPQKLNPVSTARDLTRIFPQFTAFRPHPNSVATYLEGWLPLSLAMAIRAERRWMRALMGTATVIVAIAIFLSASLGAWVALALCLLLWWATRSRRRLGVTAAGFAAAGVVLAGHALWAGRALSESQSTISRALASILARPDRLDVYRGSWYLIQDFPFTGIGLGGAFPMVYSRYVLIIRHPFLTYSHNLFLEIWLRQGLAGILAFGWLVIGFLLFVRNTYGQGGALGAGAWLGVATTLLHGLTDARQYADGWPLVSLFTLLGLAVASGGNLGEEQTERMSQMRKLGGIAVVAGLAAILVFAGRPITAVAYANAGALSQARGELAEGLTDEQKRAWLNQAASYHGQAIEIDQANRTAHQRLGTLAIDAGRPDDAVAHLKAAQRADPDNTTTHKALGLAYTWTGRLHHAEQLLADIPDMVEELNVWGWWWRTQDEPEWAANAYKVSLLLRPNQPSTQEALAGLTRSLEEGAGPSQ